MPAIAALLDHLRRRRLLYDSRREIFSRYWNEGDREIQRGYLPVLPGPQGMKLRAAADDDKARVFQWIGSETRWSARSPRSGASPTTSIPAFLEGLWQYLTGPAVGAADPRDAEGKQGPRIAELQRACTRSIRSKLLLSENHGYYRCQRCRRKVMRRPPGNKCLAWQCDGELEFIREDQDNYNLQLMDERYSMLRPEEHTAMVPQEHRERFENWFKGSGDVVNTLVCTPTWNWAWISGHSIRCSCATCPRCRRTTGSAPAEPADATAWR